MYQVHYLNPISSKGTELLKECYKTAENVEDAQAILVRSGNMLDMEFSPELLTVARAGAGVNNIPLERCAQQGIVVFNTPVPTPTAWWSLPSAVCFWDAGMW